MAAVLSILVLLLIATAAKLMAFPRHRLHTLRCSASETLTIPTGEVTFKAAEGEGAGEGGVPRFEMLAYTGEAMQFPKFKHPVVVDLAGMRIDSKSKPIRFQHDSRHGVGHTESLEVRDGKLYASGIVSRDTDAAREIVTSGRRGFPWQASIGVSEAKLDLIKAGKSAEVNGHTFQGPVFVATSCRLDEISFTDAGRDPKTVAMVAAQEPEDLSGATGTRKGAALATLATLTAAAGEGDDDIGDVDAILNEQRAENERRAKILKMMRDKLKSHPHLTEQIGKLAEDALEASTSPRDLELSLLRLCNRSVAPGMLLRRDAAAPKLDNDVIQAAICKRAMLAGIEKQFKPETLEAADSHFKSGLSLQKVILKAAQARGFDGDSCTDDVDRTLRFAFGGGERLEASGPWSTINLPGILSAVANKFLLEGFGMGDQSWRAISKASPANDFKPTKVYGVDADVRFTQLGPSGEVEHGALADRTYNNQVRPFGRILGVSREDIINDDLGAFGRIREWLGIGAIDALNHAFWTEFLDNASFFASGNNNYASGSGTALAATSLAAAKAKFWRQTDANGVPAKFRPRVLLVPPELEFTAQALVMPAYGLQAPSASALTPTANPHAGQFVVVVSPFLSAAAYPGYSTTAWYVTADPASSPAAVMDARFLNGRQEPVITETQADLNTSGFLFRGLFDFGVAKQEPKAGVKYLGDA